MLRLLRWLHWWQLLPWAILLLLLLLGCRQLLQTFQRGRETLDTTLAGFTQENLSHKWESYLTHLRHAGQGRLEVAVLQTQEIVSRSEETRWFWGLLPLGQETVEIRVPVIYRFYLDLAQPWEFRTHENVCLVFAPDLQPTLPPAILTQGLEKRIDRSWLSFSADRHLEELEKNLSLYLSRKAHTWTPFVADQARYTVKAFLLSWGQGENIGFSGNSVLQVVFPHELPPSWRNRR